MSEADVAVVRRVYEAWSAAQGLGDPVLDEMAAECLGDGYEWRFARPEGTGLEPSYRGLEGWRAAIGAWLENWEAWETEPEEFVDLGDRILVLSRSRGRSRDGLTVDVETAELHHLENGRVVRTVSYPSRTEAT
jgi:ketosteroid isomerase-like protein